MKENPMVLFSCGERTGEVDQVTNALLEDAWIAGC